jgi:acetyl-CoA carboxylase carboxyl transferase subunit alpha
MARSKPQNDAIKNALPFEKAVRELDVQIEEMAAALAAEASGGKPQPPSGPLKELIAKRDELLAQVQADLTIWKRIQLSRHVDRPVTIDYVELMLTDVVELHGDRLYGDDKAIFTGFATLNGRKIMLVAHRKGRTTQERIACNWGCAHPEGYRKALRCMQLAERQKLPILTLINTPGAYPGIGAEERGQASAIAWSILEMFHLKVPVVSVVIGEGGSGGALGIGVCDRLLILENSYYSVISPEGCASILWKDGARAEEAALSLKLGSDTLVDLGVADELVPEPMGGAHRDKAGMAGTLKAVLVRHFDELCALPVPELMARRAAKYRDLGTFVGASSAV